MDKLLITIGLPGSGKTTWSKEYQKQNDTKRRYHYSSQNGKSVKHIEFDDLINSYNYRKLNKKEAMEEIISNNAKNQYDELILDGLFLTNEDVIKAIDKVNNYCTIENIEIHYWIPDIEASLWNDKYRRNENSEITIKNGKIEEPNLDLLKTEFKKIQNIKIINHNIVRRPEYKVFADRYDLNLKDDLYLTSDSWCLGGSYQNCWGTGGSVSADTQPSSFIQLDSLLEKVCPNISFLQYKKINNSCVDIDTYRESDYYGGSTEEAYFRCNIEELYNILVELTLINEDNF